MSVKEFTIEIGDGRVVGRLKPGDGTFRAETKIDKLQLDTVDVLEDWLKRWKWIAELRTNGTQRPLLVPETFRVLGTHLWRLILHGNKVGEGLIAACNAVRADDEPLRVLLTFDDSDTAKALAKLPWEFLYYPGTDGQAGYYLATEARLVLSRYLQRESARPEMTPAEKPRVIFWLTLPDRPEFTLEREKCRATRDGLAALYDEELDVREMIDGWRPDDVIKQLDSKADIVHVIGVCRVEDKASKLYISENNWVDPQTLVKVLVGKPGSRPELVVLHLCDWSGSNANENFERIAPSLILADVPAVLAMQYPMAPGDADRFICAFYKRLVEGDDIGKAVQAGRGQMQDGLDGSEPDRRFGAPVLYLQSEDGHVRPGGSGPKFAQAGLVTVTTTIATAPAPTTADQEILDLLLDVVEVKSPDRESATAFAAWIGSTPWPDDREEAWKIVRSRARDHVDEDRLRPLYAALLRALRTER